MSSAQRAWLAGAVVAASVLFLSAPRATATPDISGNLAAQPYQFHGRAPHRFNFHGKIQVQGIQKHETVTVAYSYAFSDGSTQPGGQFTFRKDGVRQIHTYWKFGSPGDNGSGWCELKLSAPVERSICKANFSYQFK